jgi:hypothetical protein
MLRIPRISRSQTRFTALSLALTLNPSPRRERDFEGLPDPLSQEGEGLGVRAKPMLRDTFSIY